MMVSSLGHIERGDPGIMIPVFLTLVMMPLTFSIANGVSSVRAATTRRSSRSGQGRLTFLTLTRAGSLYSGVLIRIPISFIKSSSPEARNSPKFGSNT
jgi:hypothetical protein